jgi:fructuronate reductase
VSLPTIRWVHFGAGNLFRALVAPAFQDLLDAGEAGGLAAVSVRGAQAFEGRFTPGDHLFVVVSAGSDGTLSTRVLTSVSETLAVDGVDGRRLRQIFEAPALQMVTFTITEKAYTSGPGSAAEAVAELLAFRFDAGALPVALVSLDNCASNGDRLGSCVVEAGRRLVDEGRASPGLLDYLGNPARVSFPWTMVDKITPGPAELVRQHLAAQGLAGFPFVNAEVPQYLVIEDAFPNGRPPLHLVRGVWFTDRDTVSKAEAMKVSACLNPLHTTLALTGGLLGFALVREALADPDLRALVDLVGAQESLPVVDDPGILNPAEFLRTVVEERLPNPFLPDTTARIATDTSQKVGVRFGRTLRAYRDDPRRDPRTLVGIPFVLACWLRYRAGVDDAGRSFVPSPDPWDAELDAVLGHPTLGGPVPDATSLLAREDLFGVDLMSLGLGPRIQRWYAQMLRGPGAVRTALREATAE